MTTQRQPSRHYSVEDYECGRLLGGVFVAGDLELYRSRWVFRRHQRFDDADGVDGFGDGLHPGT